MNKSIIIGAVLIVAAGLGYYQFSYKPAQEAAMKAAEEAKAAEDAAKKAAEEAAAKAAEGAKAATDAAAAATQAATDAAAAATQAATDAAAAATDAAAGAAADIAALLDPANFNAESITAAIDASTLDQATKDTLKSAVTAAASNPALVQGAIDQIKKAMGM
jgi:hypothetical protein